MVKSYFAKISVFCCLLLLAANFVFAQGESGAKIISQEVSEKDGIPVLIKHLPEWENVRNSVTHTNNVNDLRQALGDKPIFDLVDFAGGTEAVAAPYAQGKLLIIEYNTPQASVDADNKFSQRLAEIGQNERILYRRIGNYSAFVFDVGDEAGANALLDQVKYEKTVQWLGRNPNLVRQAERAFINTTSSLFVSTVLAIVGSLGLALLTGIVVGVIFFYVREHKRSTMEAFSDAGGMTRLNLDNLTPHVSHDRLLKD